MRNGAKNETCLLNSINNNVQKLAIAIASDKVYKYLNK